MTKPIITFGHGFLTDCNDMTGWVETEDGNVGSLNVDNDDWFHIYIPTASGTADSGDTTTTVDSERTEADDYWNNCFITFTNGPNIGLERQITHFDAGTDTLTHDAFPNPVAAGHTYDISGSGGNKVYYISYPKEGGATNLSLSTTVYTKIFFRYVTGSATTIKAKILLVFYGWNGGWTEAQNLAAGNGQIVLAETNTADHFLTGSTTITSGKIIDHIRLYANQATGNVWYDFALICKGIFILPNTQYGTEFTPPPRNVDICIPSRITDVTQNLGSPNATWNASCNLDISNATDDWKRPQGTLTKGIGGDVVNGQVFIDIAHNSVTEPFQWLNTGKQQFKVTLDSLRFPEHSDSHTLDLTFKEYSRSSKSNETYVERFGLNL